MLSPGKHFKKVPKDPQENVAFRKWLLLKGRENSRLREGMIEACTQDILFWINSFVCQYNPLKPGSEYGPFITWDFQDEAVYKLLNCIGGNKTVVIEKSREMGGTYLCLLVFDWISMFHKWKKFLVISRSAEAVDNPGDPDCVFWKFDQVHHYMPDWLKGPITRTKMFFEFERTGSKITGQASTGKAGVGGRATAMLIDEFSQVKEDKEVRQRTASTTNCRIFNGTHLGMATEFYNLCQQPEIDKIQMHWTQHPDKCKGLYKLDHRGLVEILDKSYVFPPDYKFILDGSPVGGPYPGIRSPWYDEKCKDIGDSRGVAMDLDINPSGSVRQFFNAIRLREIVLRYSRRPMWEGRVEYDRDCGIPDRLVEELNGPIKLWMNPLPGGKIPPGKYAVAVDNSAGTGATPTCFSIGNRETKEKIGQYANPYMDAKSAAPFAIALCMLFADQDGTGARLCFEMPGPGVTFRNTVRDLGYSNIHLRVSEERFAKRRSESLGWASTPPAKLTLLEEYRHAIEHAIFLNYSEGSLKDCLSYQYERDTVEHQSYNVTDDPSGARVNHGDQVIADAMVWMMIKHESGSRVVRVEEEIRPGSLAWRRMLHDNAREQADQWL